MDKAIDPIFSDHVSNTKRLRFSGELEKAFQNDYFDSAIVPSRLALALGLFLYMTFGILDQWMVPSAKDYIWIIRYGIVCPIIIAVLILSFRPYFRRIIQPACSLAVLASGFGLIAMNAIAQPNDPGYSFYYTGLILVLMLAYSLAKLRFWYATISNLTIVVVYELVCVMHHDFLATQQGLLVFLNNNFFLIAANVVGILTCYSLEFYARRDFLQRRAIEFEKEKSERLLLNVLPEEVAVTLKEGKRDGTIAQHFEAVTILFADVVGFTPISSKLSPHELVELLNELFSHFDNLVEKHDLEKIKTIGDCYMVASGVPTERDNHAQVMTLLALEMLDYVEKKTFSGGIKLNLRIGLNSGPVIAGVIGHKKFAYDLWGDTVNVASRMESHGGSQQIQITRSTYELIKDDFDCHELGSLTVKGKGEMETWTIKNAVK